MKPATIIPHVFNSVEISQRGDDGYVNATAACKAVGKQFNDYSRLDTTQAFLAALSTETGIPVSVLVRTQKGGDARSSNKILQGTWVHPHVAIHLGQWLSPQFAVAVAKWVFDWMSADVEGKSAQAEPDNMELARRSNGILRMLSRKVTTIEKAIPEIERIIQKQLCEVLPAMVEAQLERDPRYIAVEYKPALSVLLERKVPSRKRRAFSQKVSARLRRFCTSNRQHMKLSRETGRYLFPTEAIEEWLKTEGDALISGHIAAVRGQGVLPFNRTP